QLLLLSILLFFLDTAPSEIYTLSLHDALPICEVHQFDFELFRNSVDANVQLLVKLIESVEGTYQSIKNINGLVISGEEEAENERSEEHTSELQSRENLVCRLLLEKKKKKQRPK